MDVGALFLNALHAGLRESGSVSTSQKLIEDLIDAALVGRLPRSRSFARGASVRAHARA